MLSIHVDDQLIACSNPATDTEFAEAKHRPYPQIVGSILYASTISRPDLLQPASVLSRFIGKWNETHYQAAKHLLRYIRGTTDLSLVFNGDCGKQIIQGYEDAGWGGDLDTRRSTTGHIFKVYEGTIAWKSQRQPNVALLTTEAEDMASADATRQATWLRLLLDDLQIGLPTNSPISILNDNNGGLALSKDISYIFLLYFIFPISITSITVPSHKFDSCVVKPCRKCTCLQKVRLLALIP
jgi:hypothetical protein